MERDVETISAMQAEEERYQFTKDVINASDEQIERYNAMDVDGHDTRQKRYRRCRSCGQGGYAGQYPFSTLGGTICDDCV